jgi:hypothetical protein
MVGGQEFALIAKIQHHPSQSLWLLELMCFSGLIIQGADESTYNDFGPTQYKASHKFRDGKSRDHRPTSSEPITKHHYS